MMFTLSLKPCNRQQDPNQLAQPKSNHHNIHIGYRLFAEIMNYGRREYVLPSSEPWVTDDLLLHLPGLKLLKSLAEKVSPNTKLKPITLEYVTVIGERGCLEQSDQLKRSWRSSTYT